MILPFLDFVKALTKPSLNNQRGQDTTRFSKEHKMEIIQNPNVMSHRSGTLWGLTYKDIYDKLGFPPNVMDDEAKVAYSWGFNLDGSPCAVWDWKGSHTRKVWSAFGPHDKMKALFGDAYEGGGL